MTLLESAMLAANARKEAAGLHPNGNPHIAETDEMAARAIYSGFDIGIEELFGTLQYVAAFFSNRAIAHDEGLFSLFIACWNDAFLTGLFAGSKSVAPHHDPPGPDTAPSGSGGNIS